jgi:hypothetical protein
VSPYPSVFSFLMPGDMMMGMVPMNGVDRWLHVALAMVILYADFDVPRETKAAGA